LTNFSSHAYNIAIASYWSALTAAFKMSHACLSPSTLDSQNSSLFLSISALVSCVVKALVFLIPVPTNWF